MLNDEMLRLSLEKGIERVLLNRNNDTNEDKSPEESIKEVARELAEVISSEVSTYVRSASVSVGPQNISVTSPTGACVVAPLTPANLV